MKARLTTISLTLPGRLVEIGEVVERGADVPEDVFDARLAARTAELVGEGLELSGAAVEAITAWKAQVESGRAATQLLVETALAGTLADKRAIVDALREAGEDPRSAQHAQALGKVMVEVLDADEAELKSLSPDVSPVSGGDEAGPTAASDAGDDRGGPSPAEHTGGADQAGASTDATQPEPGLDGDAGGAQTPPAEPASPEPSAPKQKSARKGGVRGG